MNPRAILGLSAALVAMATVACGTAPDAKPRDAIVAPVSGGPGLPPGTGGGGGETGGGGGAACEWRKRLHSPDVAAHGADPFVSIEDEIQRLNEVQAQLNG